MHFELYSDIKSYPSTGVVKHPKDWLHGGYVEIQNPPSRYAIINLPVCAMLCGFKSIKSLQDAHWEWIETALKKRLDSVNLLVKLRCRRKSWFY